jgi:hypothetical protein
VGTHYITNSKFTFHFAWTDNFHVTDLLLRQCARRYNESLRHRCIESRCTHGCTTAITITSLLVAFHVFPHVVGQLSIADHNFKVRTSLTPCGYLMSRNSLVYIATGYGLDDRMIGVRFSAGAENFSLRHHVQTGSGTHPASYLMGTGAPSLGVKRPGREADHSPSSKRRN